MNEFDLQQPAGRCAIAHCAKLFTNLWRENVACPQKAGFKSSGLRYLGKLGQCKSKSTTAGSLTPLIS